MLVRAESTMTRHFKGLGEAGKSLHKSALALTAFGDMKRQALLYDLIEMANECAQAMTPDVKGAASKERAFSMAHCEDILDRFYLHGPASLVMCQRAAQRFLRQLRERKIREAAERAGGQHSLMASVVRLQAAFRRYRVRKAMAKLDGLEVRHARSRRLDVLN